MRKFLAIALILKWRRLGVISATVLHLHVCMWLTQNSTQQLKNGKYLSYVLYSRASHNAAFGPPKICSVVQISTVQGSVFQHCASYFISINPRFQHCASYFISVNPRFQHCTRFFLGLIQGSALCKNFQELLVISTSSPRSALFEAVLCEALVCSTFPTFIIKKLKLLCICIFLKCGISNNSCGFEFSN